MPFHDLNVVHHTDSAILSHLLSFHHELGYQLVALAIALTGKLPPTLPQVSTAGVEVPKDLKILTRMTLTISDNAQNHRISALNSTYDILALRPTTEKTFQLCCSSIECDIISLDLSQRLPFILKFKTVASALQRGIRFEICYSLGINGGSDARRNLISGAAGLIRATRGRGIIISSEAKNALGLRAPADVVNLARVWGLSQERGKETVCEEAERVVKLARMKRTSFRGVVDVLDGGSQELTAVKTTASKEASDQTTTQPIGPKVGSLLSSQVTSKSIGVKRKAAGTSAPNTVPLPGIEDKPLSKRELKRRAKKARLEDKANAQDKGTSGTGVSIKRETSCLPSEGRT